MQILFSAITLLTVASVLAETSPSLPPICIILIGDWTMAIRSGSGPGFSAFFTRMVADELAKAVPELQPYLKP